jgi:hypothetical protein
MLAARRGAQGVEKPAMSRICKCTWGLSPSVQQRALTRILIAPSRVIDLPCCLSNGVVADQQRCASPCLGGIDTDGYNIEPPWDRI